MLVCVGKGKAFLGGWQTFTDFCPEVVATGAEDCDKTLTRQQNHVAKLLCLQHPGLKPKHVERDAFKAELKQVPRLHQRASPRPLRCRLLVV